MLCLPFCPFLVRPRATGHWNYFFLPGRPECVGFFFVPRWAPQRDGKAVPWSPCSCRMCVHGNNRLLRLRAAISTQTMRRSSCCGDDTHFCKRSFVKGMQQVFARCCTVSCDAVQNGSERACSAYTGRFRGCPVPSLCLKAASGMSFQSPNKSLKVAWVPGTLR